MSQTPSGNRWEHVPDDTAPLSGAPVEGPPRGAPPAAGAAAGSRPAMTYDQVVEAEPVAPRSTPVAGPTAAPGSGVRGRWASAGRGTRIGLAVGSALLVALGLFGAGFAAGRTTAPGSGTGTGDTPVNQLPDGNGFGHRHGPDDGPDGVVPPDQGELPDQGQPAPTGARGRSGSVATYVLPGATVS